MKGIISKIILVSSLSLLAFSTSFAAMDSSKMDAKKMKWKCETNASTSNDAKEQKADDEMKNKAMSAKDAYSFALKHCRDCNKITCTMENM